jgi:hypothetical protein
LCDCNTAGAIGGGIVRSDGVVGPDYLVLNTTASPHTVTRTRMLVQECVAIASAEPQWVGFSMQ